MLKKISNRIILSFLALIISLVAILLFVINSHVRENHINIIKKEMKEKLRFVDLIIRQNPDFYLHLERKKRKKNINTISEIIDLRVTLIDFKGKVRADSSYDDVSIMDNHLYRIEIRNALEHIAGESIRYSNTLKTDMLYSALKSNSIVIRLAKPLCEVEKSIAELRKYFILSGILMLIASIIIFLIITKRITRPINETIAFAAAFAKGDYSKRILNYSEDEIGTLQKSLNRLADTVLEKINSLVFEQNKLEITIESILDGIAVVDINGRILIANQALKSLLGITIDVEGRMFFEAVRSRSLNAKIEYALETGLSNSSEEQLFYGKHCDVFITPIKEKKTIQGILIVLHDITEKKKIEQIKTDLVGNMSHELKTPITILKGYLETMGEHLNNHDMMEDFLKKALINVDRQNSLINDILKLNMLETSKEFIAESIDVVKIINDCIKILSPKALRKNIKIKMQRDKDIKSVKGNKFLSEEVFFNIIDNAIDYNRENGRVCVSVNATSSTITVKISDSGFGIPDESLERVFERFYRVDKSRSRATGGTGLGLSIVKHAAELLNWDINLTSGKEGSCFTIKIKCA